MKTFAMFAVLSLAVAGAVGAADRPASYAYLPGFGEFMSATQMRHAKLWLPKTGVWPHSSSTRSRKGSKTRQGCIQLTRAFR
jgi:hypothetical protein